MLSLMITHTLGIRRYMKRTDRLTESMCTKHGMIATALDNHSGIYTNLTEFLRNVDEIQDK
jgi:hypothetical protein